MVRGGLLLLEVEGVPRSSYQCYLLIVLCAVCLPVSPVGVVEDIAECLYEEVPGAKGGDEFGSQPPPPGQLPPPAVPAPRGQPHKPPGHHPPPSFRAPLPPGIVLPRRGEGSRQLHVSVCDQLSHTYTFFLTLSLHHPHPPFPSSTPPLPLLHSAPTFPTPLRSLSCRLQRTPDEHLV